MKCEIEDTPRTSSATFTHYDGTTNTEFEYVRVDFARSLERERDEAVAILVAHNDNQNTQ